MRIRVKNVDIARELALLEKIVGQKPTIAVLGNVLIQTVVGGIMLSATDLEIGLVGACEAEIEEPGAVTLPAKKLVEIIRAQSDSVLTLTTGPKGSTLFTSGQFNSKLQSLPAADFPGIPSIDGHPSITLPRAPLRQMIAQVRYAASDKGAKYFMNGAHLALKENEILFVTTDGARMSLTKTTREGPEWGTALIPGSALDELSALLAETATTEVVFARSERHLFFDLDGRLLISRMVEGNFPKYERIIPKANEHHMVVDRQLLIAVLKRCVLINEIVSLHLRPGQLSITSLHADVGEGAEELTADYSGPSLVMRYKGQYLLDYLNQAVGDTVTLAVKDETTAMLLLDGEYQGVVMGMTK